MKKQTSLSSIWWAPDTTPALWRQEKFLSVLEKNNLSLAVITNPSSRQIGIGVEGTLMLAKQQPAATAFPVRATLPGIYPEQLGSDAFRRTHGLRFSYVGGSMARGISSPQMVVALARIGALGFYGTAGLPLKELEAGLQYLQQHLSGELLSWGANLIHSPGKPELEEKTVDLFLQYQVRRVEASAFMDLQPEAVRYACSGLQKDQNGRVIRQNYLFAKVSRPEVARHFMLPPPQTILQELVAQGKLSEQEAECGSKIPLAEDITVEADSGGHTDNRPLTSLFSRLNSLRAELQAPVRLGAAGGLGTPDALAAAFAQGADYVLLGSVHQGTTEAGISQAAKKMLAEADIADMGMTASADMFEQGIRVQVLTRGTLMAARGNMLYQLYKTYSSLDKIPARDRAALEKNIFRESLEHAWQRVRERAEKRSPERLAQAEQDPKRKMAMLFRAYLGQSSRWPIEGNPERTVDYQIWCGPAMGAFNAWTKGSFLENPENRTMEQVALNLLQGATQITRVRQLRLLGVPLPPYTYVPEPLTI
ncbi:MAG: PfaD family polyunsaturated fatty acid/polyketide biosynthesis protein [Gammaproteobacteria bacterium]|nr:PfaD family polyunsaturated fatty acid/polyketide biosynthesis protein [Gammaproteobacteria bacterium]